MNSRRLRLLWAIPCVSMLIPVAAIGQQQSVKPGINDSFVDPNAGEYVERFEIESREVFNHRQAILRVCNVQPGQAVADIGAGTGLFTRLLSDAVGSEGQVIAVDIADNFLTHIRQTSEQLGQTNVRTILATAESTELAENSIDLAFICDTYHHFEYPQKTLASLHQALKPGGRIILIDFKRIPGISRQWTLDHVRAGQEVFEREITDSGFDKTREVSGILEENYMVEFTKVDLPALEPQGSSTAGETDELGLPELPSGPLGKMIQLGRDLVENTATHPLSQSFVGNALNCTSCHLQNGTDPRAATFLGVATAYPAWAPREGRVITLEDRVLNCFMRSCNGTRPPLGSEVSVAITTYITWLSTGQPVQMNAQRSLGPNAVPGIALKADQANREQGAELFADRCAGCHGDDGQGDQENPPVWGPQSYNDGAGLANVPKLASWLKVAMPPDDTDLTDQQALDIADYVNSWSRPAFVLADHLPAPAALGEYNSEHQP